MAAVGEEVEGLGLNVGTAHDLPLQRLFGELGIGRLLGLHRNRLQGFGSIVVVRESHAVGLLLVLQAKAEDGGRITSVSSTTT